MGRITVVETGLQFDENKLAYIDPTAVEMFVVHHAGDGQNADLSAAEVHQMHLNNGWAGCGYHFIIRQDGTIERGRPRAYKGSHCPGANSNSLGINVMGDFMIAEPTPEQIVSLVGLLADLHDVYGLAVTDGSIVGHRDKLATACPGDNLYNLLPDIRAQVAVAIGGA